MQFFFLYIEKLQYFRFLAPGRKEQQIWKLLYAGLRVISWQENLALHQFFAISIGSHWK